MLKHKKSILYKSVDMMNDSIFTSENNVIITMWPKKKSDFQKNRYLSIYLSFKGVKNVYKMRSIKINFSKAK